MEERRKYKAGDLVKVADESVWVCELDELPDGDVSLRCLHDTSRRIRCSASRYRLVREATTRDRNRELELTATRPGWQGLSALLALSGQPQADQPQGEQGLKPDGSDRGVSEVETVFIPAGTLDPIEIFVTIYAEHSARLTVVCYDTAWAASFMAMGRPWRQFITFATPDYLANALGRGHRKTRAHDEKWLLNIVMAVQSHLREQMSEVSGVQR